MDERALGSHAAKPADLKKPWGVEEIAGSLWRRDRGRMNR
jgi:hypothetical protein